MTTLLNAYTITSVVCGAVLAYALKTVEFPGISSLTALKHPKKSN